jgi:hypothetical protein
MAKVGGDGGIDYVTADAAGRRMLPDSFSIIVVAE